MEEELIHLIVQLCSDGTLLAYDPNKKLNLVFTSLTSWSTLHDIYKYSTLSSAARKGIDRNFNIKYVKYYFKNTKTNEEIEIPKEHISSILSNINKG